MTGALVVDGVTKRFGRSAALEGASLQANEGEILALLGPSGSGKTTLLRVIAGLEHADAGSVVFKGRDLLAEPPKTRGVGMVFQHYALFRHMTAAQNVAFGLKVKPRAARPPAREIAARAQSLLDRVGLGEFAGRFPAQLSGGQRQRVALARALATEPDLLLLDEPFGALDAKVRLELRRWVRELQRELKLTTVFVTHDQEEALELADRVAVMSEGRVRQAGPPAELYAEPADAFVFGFLGGEVRLPVTLCAGRGAFGGAEAGRAGCAGPADGEAMAHVRPEAVEVWAEAPGLPATVVSARPVGPRTQFVVRLQADGRELELSLDRPPPAAVGGMVFLRPRRFQLF